ncbi:MAG: hypothetical protein EPN25_12005 [Nitrospirae bacterium]|nr:MAG: hypothetical protein EPN25_12005 [Nitrospirota bacterium]
MSGTRSFLMLFLVIVTGLLLCLMLVHAGSARRKAVPALTMKSEMVKRFGLTDLCIFTDARYTRHPSMADLHTPFQSYPLSFEHFPSGSLMPPPPHLRGR